MDSFAFFILRAVLNTKRDCGIAPDFISLSARQSALSATSAVSSRLDDWHGVWGITSRVYLKGVETFRGRPRMKPSILKYSTIALVTLLVGFVQKPQAQTRVNISMFYSSLAPYGEWIDYRDYGLCWRPTVVEAGWRPYTHGRWVWTDYGWTWVSDYSWGWAPFHYGRWLYDDYYGWIWIPDDVWGPAWVDWRTSDSYIGWAPLPPAARFRVGVGISFGGYVVPHFAWSFTNCGGFLATRLVILPVHQNAVFVRGSRRADGITFRDNRVYNVGPRVGFVERATGSRLRRSVIVDSRDFGEHRGSAVDGDRVYLHRPNFDRPKDEKPRVDVDRGRGPGVNQREPRTEQREAPPPQRERRPREFRTPPREKPSAPNLQPGRKPESRERRETRKEGRAPQRSEGGRPDRGEPHFRQR